VRAALAVMGVDTGRSVAAIVPVVIGAPEQTMQVCQALLERGIFVQGIRPPTVPAGSSRLRVNLSALHTDEHIGGLLAALQEVFP
jgi:7-keto-8-aminopelargonate synthetase-like enzyme